VSHPNARLTVRGRMLIVERAQAGWVQAHIAAAMGVSRHCVRRWLERYAAEGATGLHDRSSRPHRSPRRTAPTVEAAVVRLRRRERLGRDVIADRLGLSPRSVSRILVRHGLPHLACLDPITGQLVRASRTTTVRYERDRPGELVHMDVKKLARIPDGGGWRAHGRGSDAIRRDRDARIGFDYVHALVDDHSRLAYAEVLPDERGTTCMAFLERAIDHFARHGITRIERLLTDNAWAYRYSLRSVCDRHGIAQRFIRPRCPWQNGKVERFNRTLQTEWAYRRIYVSNDARTAALDPWLEGYNTRRRHSAIGGRPPVSRLAPMS
jgi:transposase InsO family protein